MSQFSEVSPAEWKILRIIWTLNSATSTVIISELGEHNNWNDSTVKTLIGRLVKKGLLNVDNSRRPFVYSVKDSEDDGNKYIVQMLLDDVCDMKKANAIGNMIKNSPISVKDIDKLVELLKNKREFAPSKVNCNCLNGGI